jgi:hypothetical protein
MRFLSEDLDNLADIEALMEFTNDQPSTSKAALANQENNIVDENNIPLKKTRKMRSKEEIRKDKVRNSRFLFYIV